MRYDNKSWNRSGRVFYNSKDSFDLSGVRVLHTGVDTVKQLYNCLLRSDVLCFISDHYDMKPGTSISLGGVDWKITRSSKQSGYQWILKNLDVGFVVLLKSFYADENLNASHIKIEVTPQTIYSEYTPDNLTSVLNRVAALFATQIKPNGIAAHIAVDLKGFDVPQDFEQRLVAKAKRQYRVNNISNVQISLNETAAVYGNGQTYTFGSAGALQLCIYEKDQEVIKSDKLDFWEDVWGKVPSVNDSSLPEYQHGDSVRRIEARFHHSIIREFCHGSKNTKTGELLEINTFSDLCEHLTALWRYTLNNFRLQHSSSYVDPLWQLLGEDVEIYPPVPNWDYKRGKKQPNSSSGRNVAFWLGNVLRLMARKRFRVDYVVNYILRSGLDDDLAAYFRVPRYGHYDVLRMCLREFVKDRLETHLLNGVAA